MRKFAHSTTGELRLPDSSVSASRMTSDVRKTSEFAMTSGCGRKQIPGSVKTFDDSQTYQREKSFGFTPISGAHKM
jgi:hypothetical protein